MNVYEKGMDEERSRFQKVLKEFQLG